MHLTSIVAIYSLFWVLAAFVVMPFGVRTATCLALDHIELARVSRADFLLMVQQFPTVRQRLIKLSLQRLRGDTGGGAEPGLGQRVLDTADQ